MFSISIDNLFAVSAPDEAGLERMIARAVALREEHEESLVMGPSSRPNVQGGTSSHDGEQMLNVAAIVKLQGGKRFRMTDEERATYGQGPLAREEAAAQRLKGFGKPSFPIGGGSVESAPGEVQGVAWAGELDPATLTTDF